MTNGEPIVIIEDDPDDQDILREVFHDLEVQREIVFFSDCNDAFDYLLSVNQKPFLIICDINLPKINGIQLKQKIDSTDQLRQKAIPFVFLTTADNRSTVDQAYQITNLQGYFRKGHLLPEIRQNIKCILDYWSTALHPGT